MGRLGNARLNSFSVLLVALLLSFGSAASLLAGPFVLLPSTTVAGPYTLTQVPSIAPNVYGSPNWNHYVQHATYALELGLTTAGSAGPAQYNAVTSGFVLPGDVVASGFNSWRGFAPGTYAGEFGNRLHYGLRIVSAGPTFQLAGLWNDMNSTDAINLFDFDRGYGTAFPFQYSGGLVPPVVGLNYGPDGIKGTGDDLPPITSGPATQPIHELLYVGVGNAIWADYMTGLTDQDKLNAAKAYAAEMNVNNRYCLYGTGQQLICSPAVPEPGTGLLLLVGLGAVAAVRRWKRA